MFKATASLIFTSGYVILLLVCGCSEKEGQGALTDKPLASFQGELLDLAFETATAIKVDPHIKDRSRAQEAVVAACLKLNQPARAACYIQEIDNWRRGLGYANLAFYCAQNGSFEQARHYLKLTEKIAGKVTGKSWRKDRINARVARTYAMLEQTDRSEKILADPSQSKAGKDEEANAVPSEEHSFDDQLKSLEALAAQKDIDTVKNVLQAYAEIFNRFYNDNYRRVTVEDKIRTAWAGFPVFMRLDLITTLAEYALDHDDRGKALQLIDEAQSLLGAGQWPPERRVPIAAKLAALRFSAGDADRAHFDADAALAIFNGHKGVILDIYRAQTIRPLAEAYQSMGRPDKALSVYKQAIKEGAENPNSRPRAEDFSANCCSMALHAMEPDAELWTQIREIYDGLRQSE